MRVTVTGATGLIGRRVVAALMRRGDAVTILSRDPERAKADLGRPDSGAPHADSLAATRWDPNGESAPRAALERADAVVHLAGENVAQRWTGSAKRAIRESRVLGTRNLVLGIEALGETERPKVLVSGSAIGYYGAHGDEPIDEESAAGEDFLAQTCAQWEAEAEKVARLGVRLVKVRTGVVLDSEGGALGKMLPAFKLGVGGPVASGRQYISWIHTDDVLGILLAAIDDERWQGAINATAPEPQRNRDFSKALGRALHRPSLLPVPGMALRLMYGDMARVVTEGARVLPAKALVLGYDFRHPQLDEALRATLG
ncbi:MAG: TIGR01777 family oxidoreductase [Solirubrobacteraceae bacterium]